MVRIERLGYDGVPLRRDIYMRQRQAREPNVIF